MRLQRKMLLFRASLQSRQSRFQNPLRTLQIWDSNSRWSRATRELSAAHDV